MKPDLRRDVTTLLLDWRGGDEQALVELMPLVYKQLREIARRLLRHERSRQTLETASLVHEAYLRLVEIDRVNWKNRTHFYAMSARVMRRVLVDHARYRRREKRGGDLGRVEASKLTYFQREPPPAVLAVDEAMHELAKHDAQLAQLVELRFFGGLGRDEIGEILGVSGSTITRRWVVARAWLIRYLGRAEV